MTTGPQDQESKDSIADQLNEVRQSEIEGYEIAVKKARNALFWTAGLIFAWEMISMYRTIGEVDIAVVIFAVIVAAIFTALGFWTKKKPYTALICGLIAFIVYILLTVLAYASIEGASGVMKALFSGIFIKVVIFINLVRPFSEAKALQEALKTKY